MYLVFQAGTGRARQEVEVDEGSCTFCLDSMENMLDFKVKGYRSFRRQFDRMNSNMKLMGMYW